MESESEGYFLYHSIGLYPAKAADMAASLGAFARHWSAPGSAQWDWTLRARQRFLDLWAALLNIRADTLTTTESVTQGLAALLMALPEARLRGRAILVAADGFPSLHFLLQGLAPRLGVELRTVPLREGAHWVEEADILAAWDGDVALALLTAVTSTASHRLDLVRLLAHGRATGSLVGADLTQGAGLLPYDLGRTRLDFALSTTLKWLCGAPGAGMLHVSPDLMEECRPALRGWFGQEDPFQWALDGFAFAPDARRFDIGTPAPLAAIASGPALAFALAQPEGEALARNRRLMAPILEAASRLGLPLASPLAESRRGGSLMLDLETPSRAERACARLRERGLHLDARGPLLRLSPGWVTTERGVSRLLDALPGVMG